MDVRQFQPDDLPKLLRFLARHYPECAAKAEASYFHWRFRDNPLGSSLNSCWLVLENDLIVGQLAGIRDHLHAGGQWHDTVWLVDLMIAPEYRGQLAALRLFQALMNQHPLLLTVGAGPHMQRIYESLGWQQQRIAETYYMPIHPTRLYHLAVDSGRVSARLGMRGPAMAMADVILPSLQSTLGTGRNRASSDFKVSALESFDSEVDELFDELLPSLGVTSIRTSEQLHWKFASRPIGTHAAWAARESKSGSLRGYLVTKRMVREGIACWAEIVDYLLPPEEPEIFNALVTTACRAALKEGLDFVRFRLSNPRHREQLTGPWWREHTASVSDDVFIYSQASHLKQLLVAGPWHLTSLASDRADYGRDDWLESPQKTVETSIP